MTIRKRKPWLWGSLLLLLIGGMIYILFRSRQTLINLLLDHAGANGLEGVREAISQWQFPEWVVYNLPGGLWSGAYIMLIHALTMGEPIGKRLLWAGLIPALGVVSEMMQQLLLLPGGADRWDVFFYALP